MNDQQLDPRDAKNREAAGANQPKVDVSQPKNGEQTPEERAEIKAQTKRANDARAAGLTASEMIRFRELENKPNITEAETKEYQALGHKKQFGLPPTQDDQVKQAAASGNIRRATPEDIKREANDSGAGETDTGSKVKPKGEGTTPGSESASPSPSEETEE